MDVRDISHQTRREEHLTKSDDCCKDREQYRRQKWLPRVYLLHAKVRAYYWSGKPGSTNADDWTESERNTSHVIPITRNSPEVHLARLDVQKLEAGVSLLMLYADYR